MKASIKNAVRGTLHQVRGKIKELFGFLAKNTELEAAGKAETVNGLIQQRIGKIERELGR